MKDWLRVLLALGALLGGCSPPELAEPSLDEAELGASTDFGEAVGPLRARLEAPPTAGVGEVLRLRITLKNTGSTRETIVLPDLNDPRAWTVRLRPLGPRDTRRLNAGFGNVGEAGERGREKPFRIAIEPFDEKSFDLFVGGSWDGWTSYGEQKEGRLFAQACRYPNPGRYLIHAAYVPYHADRPQLENLPGWGVETNRAEIRIIARP